MDEVWERAVEAALDGQKNLSSARSLTLDGAVKCIHGRLPPPSLLEKFKQLRQLSIANVGVSSLADFPRLPHLQKLILSDNRIAGGLEYLVEAGLESLRDLDLSNNKIQYIDDLAPLAQLKLVSLDLYECPVTRVVDYRAKVFGMIKSLKYLDKADAEDNERPESDEEEDDDDDEEDDGGSGEVDGDERNGKLDAGPPDEEDEEDEDGDESDEEEEEGSGFLGKSLLYPNNNPVRSNGFGHGSVLDSHGLKAEEDDEDSSSEDEEDVDDEYEGEAKQYLRLAVDASRGFQAALNGQVNVESSSDDEEIDDEEDEEEEDVENVEVHEVEESEDDDGDDDDEDDDEDDDGDEGEEEDVEEDEDENTQPSSGPLPINAVIVTEGEIEGHESDEEDENGELGEEDEYIGEEEVEYEEEDVEEEEDEEDNGTEYLVQPVPTPVHVPLREHAPVFDGPAEDEEEASDFEDEDEDEDDDNDDDVEDEDDDEHEQRQIPSSKRKRDQDDDTDDSDDEDDDDERPNKKR